MKIKKISHSLRKRFVKDFSLPIQVLQDPYFEYMLKLVGNVYDIKSYLKFLEEFYDGEGGEQGVFECQNITRENIISYVKSCDEYKKFCDFNTASILPHIPIVKLDNNRRSVYSEDCVGKIFVSIDLVKANFQSVKFAIDDRIFKHNSYEGFIREFTDYEYLLKSKYFRQVLFGNLNPKKQQAIQKRMIDHIIYSIQAEPDFENSGIKFVSKNSDEIIIDTGVVVEKENDIFKEKIRMNNLFSHFKHIFNNCNIPYDLMVEPFVVSQIGEKNFFVKRKLNGKYSFKNVPSMFWAQCYKKYLNYNKLHPFDMVFYHDGYLAKFLNPIFIGMEVDCDNVDSCNV